MSDSNSAGSEKLNGQSGIASLEVSLSSALVGLAALILNPTLRTVMQLLGPPMGYGLAALSRWCVTRIKYRIENPDTETLIKSWIKEAERQKKDKTISLERKSAIEKDIEGFYLLLREHRINRLQINKLSPPKVQETQVTTNLLLIDKEADKSKPEGD